MTNAGPGRSAKWYRGPGKGEKKSAARRVRQAIRRICGRHERNHQEAGGREARLNKQGAT